jgi:UDP-2,3-diacylglucosamine pyrophosphatase LpxH
LDKGTFTTDNYKDLSDPNALLEERGLEPNEWDITHLKVNEWDGPYGEPLKQLTVNVRRKLAKTFPQPAFTPDDYVAPPKKAPVLTDQKLVVFVGDQQAPHHDVELHNAFCNWLAEEEPEEGVLIGDTVDFGDISRHARNPEWDASVQTCINAGYSILKDYVQASPNTKWIKLMGNHDERIRNKLLQQVASLYDLRQADDGSEEEPPVWCVSHLLRLKALGIEFIAPNGGYKHAQAIISNKLAARHGWIAKKGSGASALATLEALGYSVVVGHTHRQSVVHKTKHDIDGSIQTLAAVETGCMCQIKEGLGYTVAPDWQNGFSTASVWNDGTFKLDLATYANSVLYWRDTKYV